MTLVAVAGSLAVMEELTSLEFLLHIDAGNVIGSIANLRGLVPDVVEGVEAFNVAFDEMSREWGKACGYDEHVKSVEDWIKQTGADPGEAVRLLSEATLIGPDPAGDKTRDAHEKAQRAIPALARTYLTNGIRRDFLFGVSDLLRLRTSGAVAYLRVQCESAGLVSLMATEPTLGREWLDTTRPDLGKAFHSKWRAKINQRLGDLGLQGSYEEASNQAIHSRPLRVTRGILVGGKTRNPGEVKLAYQDIDDPRLLLFALLPYLALHMKILECVDKLYPELSPDRVATINREPCRKFMDRAVARARAEYEKMGRKGVKFALGGPEALG